jgi:hypothetical protein
VNPVGRDADAPDHSAASSQHRTGELVVQTPLQHRFVVQVHTGGGWQPVHGLVTSSQLARMQNLEQPVGESGSGTHAPHVG